MRFKTFSYIILVCSVMLLLLSSIYSLDTLSTGYQTMNSFQEVNVHSECREVRHTATNSYFAPTLSAYEWLQFRLNAPVDVEINQCLYGGHTGGECISEGGEIVSVGSGLNICRFDRSSCPVGWSQYQDWSTTVGSGPNDFDCHASVIGFGGGEVCRREGSRLTSGHTWSNTPRESATDRILYESGGAASTCGDPTVITTCYSEVTQIGCY